MKKKILGAALSVVLLTSSMSYAAEDFKNYFSDLKLFLNGTQIDKEIVLHDGTSYLPIRALSEALGLTVGWDGETKTITLDSPEVETSDNSFEKEMLSLMEESNKKLKEENEQLKALLIKNNIKIPNADEIVKYIGNTDESLGFMEQKNAAFIGNMIDNAGNTHTRGISFSDEKYEESYVVLALQGQYDKFVGTSAISTTSFKYSSSSKGVLEVYGDDNLIKTFDISRDMLPTDIEVDVKGVKVLKLTYTVGDVNSYKSANMFIGDARLIAE